jgi:plastocyanin
MRIGGIRRIVFVAMLGLGAGASFASTARAGGGGCLEFTDGQGQTVTIRDLCFSPNIIRAKPGSPITFINQDSFKHNLTGYLFYELLRPHDEVTLRFDQPGLYPFACTLHPGMIGVAVVGKGAPSAANAAPIIAPDSAAEAPAKLTNELAESPAVSDGRAWLPAGGIGLLLGAAVAGLVLVAIRRGS